MRIFLIVIATLLGLAGPASADLRSEFNAGMAAYNSGDLDTAIADFTKEIELKPDFAEAYNNRGSAYGGKRLPDQAIADFTKAIELKPDLAGAYNNRVGVSLEGAQRPGHRRCHQGDRAQAGFGRGLQQPRPRV